jgi:NAD(P)-dependent dehydrogenase (short-subunit alcohol dehydrogenase family)
MQRVAIVTGGASGIGAALAEALTARGVEVVLADRQRELAEEVADRLRRTGVRATAAELDVRSYDAFRVLAEETVARSGRIDYLFNNAGIGVGGEMSSYRVEDWDDVFDVNLRGVAYGIQAVYPHMMRQRSGHIVNTASMAGLVPATEGSYTATKYAVVGLSRALRIEAARHGVRVSVLCPGAIRTPILTGGKYGRIRIEGATDERILAAWERLRPIAPSELARKTLAAMDRNEAIIVFPKWWKALWYLERISPRASEALWSRLFDAMRRELGTP